mmetsp:Transcript_13686/g.17850  ORF Transcript_13686/g.17850 Transcript_13686/m.17850 type:complete len:108 (+) Transcript_13686:636-959(+)
MYLSRSKSSTGDTTGHFCQGHRKGSQSQRLRLSTDRPRIEAAEAHHTEVATKKITAFIITPKNSHLACLFSLFYVVQMIFKRLAFAVFVFRYCIYVLFELDLTSRIE